MSRIKMTPGEVRDLSQNYDRSSNEIQEMLVKLTNVQGQLAETWEGEGFRAFDDQFTEMKPVVERFGQLLADVHTQLMNIAQIIEQTDQEISQTVRKGF